MKTRLKFLFRILRDPKPLFQFNFLPTHKLIYKTGEEFKKEYFDYYKEL